LDSLPDTVFTYGKGGSGAGGRCETQNGDTIWDRVDCMADVLIGIKPADGTNKTQVSPNRNGISRGLIHFFMANMSSSGMGAIIGLLGLYTIYCFIFAAIKSIHTYLAAILGLAFLLTLIPMFVPFFLFKVTRNYFDKWYRIALSFVLQPVILFGFLSLMMVAFDTVLVSGNNSVLRMLIGNEANTTVPSEALDRVGAFKTQRFGETGIAIAHANQLASNFSETLQGAGMGTKVTPLGTDLRQNGMIPGVIMTYKPMEGVSYEQLAQKMDDANNSEEAKQVLTSAAIVLALTCFVFISVLNYSPTMATDLAGGVFEVPNLYETVGEKFLGADQAEGIAYNFSKKARGTIQETMRTGEVMKGLKSMVGVRR